MSNYESEGRRFESCRARSTNTAICRGNVIKEKGQVKTPGPFYRDLTVVRYEKSDPKRLTTLSCMSGETWEYVLNRLSKDASILPLVSLFSFTGQVRFDE